MSKRYTWRRIMASFLAVALLSNATIDIESYTPRLSLNTVSAQGVIPPPDPSTNSMLKFVWSKFFQIVGGTVLGKYLFDHISNPYIRGTLIHAFWFVLATAPFMDKVGLEFSPECITGLLLFGLTRTIVQDRGDTLVKKSVGFVKGLVNRFNFLNKWKHSSLLKKSLIPSIGLNILGPNNTKAEFSVFIKKEYDRYILETIPSPWAFNSHQFMDKNAIIRHSPTSFTVPLKKKFWELKEDPNFNLWIDEGIDLSKLSLDDPEDAQTLISNLKVSSTQLTFEPFYINPLGRIDDGLPVPAVGITLAGNLELSLIVDDRGNLKLQESPTNPIHRKFLIESMEESDNSKISTSLVLKGKAYNLKHNPKLLVFLDNKELIPAEMTAKELLKHTKIEVLGADKYSIIKNGPFYNPYGKLRNIPTKLSEGFDSFLLTFFSNNSYATRKEILIDIAKISAGVLTWGAYSVGIYSMTNGRLMLSPMKLGLESMLILYAFTYVGWSMENLASKLNTILNVLFAKGLAKYIGAKRKDSNTVKYRTLFDKAYVSNTIPAKPEDFFLKNPITPSLDAPPPIDSSSGQSTSTPTLGASSPGMVSKCKTMITGILDNAAANSELLKQGLTAFTHGESLKRAHRILQSRAPYSITEILRFLLVAGGAGYLSYKAARGASKLSKFIEGLNPTGETRETIELIENQHPIPDFEEFENYIIAYSPYDEYDANELSSAILNEIVEETLAPYMSDFQIINQAANIDEIIETAYRVLSSISSLPESEITILTNEIAATYDQTQADPLAIPKNLAIFYIHTELQNVVDTKITAIMGGFK